MKTEEKIAWQRMNFQDFWSQVAPCDHVLQVYDNERFFLKTLEGFIGSGLLAGDTVIVVCTANHLTSLRDRLERHDINVDALVASGKYVPLGAEELLSSIVVKGEPQETLLSRSMEKLYVNARAMGRRVRAFCEMVAVLLENGMPDAALRLERFWNKFCASHHLCLYCAYPVASLTKTPADVTDHLCALHSRLIGGWDHPCTEINHRSLGEKEIH